MRNNTLNEYQAGHFPGELVVPGVFMIDAAIQATRLHLVEEEDLAAEPSLLEIVSTRFTAKAPVADAFFLRLSVRPHEDGWISRGVFTRATESEPVRLASITLRLGPGEAGG